MMRNSHGSTVSGRSMMKEEREDQDLCQVTIPRMAEVHTGVDHFLVVTVKDLLQALAGHLNHPGDRSHSTEFISQKVLTQTLLHQQVTTRSGVLRLGLAVQRTGRLVPYLDNKALLLLNM